MKKKKRLRRFFFIATSKFFVRIFCSSQPYGYFILCLLRFSCALTMEIMSKKKWAHHKVKKPTKRKKSEWERCENREWIKRIWKCAIFYALYKTICNESLSETHKQQIQVIIIIVHISNRTEKKRVKCIHIFASFFE